MPDYSAHQTDTAVLAEVMARASEVTVSKVEGTPLVGVPDGLVATFHEELLDAPRRIRVDKFFEDAESFSVYVNTFKQPETLIVAYRKHNRVDAVLDYHGKGSPSWTTHGAKLVIAFHEDFTAWSGLSGSVSQWQFAEFIEDHMHNIAAPDGATLKDMVLKFQALKETTFKSAINLQNGDVQLTYIEDSERGNEAAAKFPSTLTLILPVYEGQLPIQVDARIRYRIKDQKLSFQVELVRKTDLLRKAFADVLQAVENLTGIKPLMGA